MDRARVLLADDHVIFLEALKKLLEPACTIVGAVTDGRALIAAAERLRPDIIIADINMPNLNGFEACDKITARIPGAKLVFLTVNEDLESAEEGIRRGASGYLLKKAAAIELFNAIQVVLQGRSYITPLITSDPVAVFASRAKHHARKQPLTSRQREVLQLLAEGKSMKEAADVLNVTPRTIAFHKYSMMEQLGLTRSSELVVYATQSGACR